jgi:excisionase family DNA binding protein
MQKLENPNRIPSQGRSCSDLELLLTVAETAERLHVSRSKVYGMASRREIGHYRLGGKILFSEQQIQSYLDSMLVPAAEAPKEKPPPVRLKHLSL